MTLEALGGAALLEPLLKRLPMPLPCHRLASPPLPIVSEALAFGADGGCFVTLVVPTPSVLKREFSFLYRGVRGEEVDDVLVCFVSEFGEDGSARVEATTIFFS